ncbi:MAG: NtaA/DmoA family FMN-dependent monooxygenase [Gordonia sp. (in: high G+C Gram-positive bacteria)]
MTMRLAANLLNNGAHPGSWRYGTTPPAAGLDIRHFVAAAQIAERGKMDAVFMADVPAASVHSIGTAPPEWAILDPLAVMAAIAVQTERIGLVPTISSTFSAPYDLARRLSSLDFISNGRAGWNIVTSASPEAATNFGLDELPTRAQRYERAVAVIETVNALWESWDADALVADPSVGRFVDTSRLHELDGTKLARGPLQLPPSPQRRLPIVQAGGSAQGVDLGAGYADAVFANQPILPDAIAFRDRVRERAVQFGRTPDEVKILLGREVIIESTEQAAREVLTELQELSGGTEYWVSRLAAQLGIDSEALDLDHRVPPELIAEDSTPEVGSVGFRHAYLRLARSGQTVRELLGQFGVAHRLVAGTPEMIADHLAEWFLAGAADGFNVLPARLPIDLERFVAEVIPILVQRKLFRREYEASTFGRNLGVPRFGPCR